ncbi:Ribosome bioproteinsis protein brx1 [Sporothrix curviconia]|uniref:Ribosome bioproteinsis protein brx1 n=1 Tax=Sporothrix curviconia TaxID=1260050 RepID=A0ABP0CEI8_9PEZI
MAAVYKSLSKANGEGTDAQSDARKKNRQRVLILSSRGVTYRHRHLMNDLAAMMPHGRKDVKFDSKSKLFQLNELAEIYNCNNTLFFEARKGKDLYMWMSKVPNVHTMEELHFTGNCLKGSRPILSFDAAFDQEPHLQLLKEMFLHIFGVPQGTRRSKPFIDHVMGFTITDGKVWVRNYQVNEVEPGKIVGKDGEEEEASSRTKSKDTNVDLVEIGPRFVLTPIVIQEGSFGGPIIYENKQFVSPNQMRSELRKQKSERHSDRADREHELLVKRDNLGLRSNGETKIQRNGFDAKSVFA